MSESRSVATGLVEASRRLHETLLLAEEEEANAHARVESLRIALREVDTLVAGSGADVPSRPTPNVPIARTEWTSQMTPAREHPMDGRRSASTPRRTRTADAIRELLSSEPRPWSVTEVVDRLAQSGDMANLESPATAIPAAIRRLTSQGILVRVGRGKYRLSGGLDAREDLPVAGSSAGRIVGDTPPPYVTAATRPLVKRGSRITVMDVARHLLGESDRLWTAREILAECAERGTPLKASDPPNALRTALSLLARSGEVVRVSPGVYRSASFVEGGGPTVAQMP